MECFSFKKVHVLKIFHFSRSFQYVELVVQVNLKLNLRGVELYFQVRKIKKYQTIEIDITHLIILLSFENFRVIFFLGSCDK